MPINEAEAQLLSQLKEDSNEDYTEIVLKDSTEDSKKTQEEKFEEVIEKVEKLEEKFVENDEKFGKLEEKVEDLRKTVTAIKAKKVPKFEKIGSKYYYIDESEKVNWFEAAHKCRELGANLSGLQSEDELKAVNEKLSNEYYWLEINDLGSEGVFKLLSTGKEAGFLKWRSPEPNNKGGNENCVQLLRFDDKYAMNDNHCETKFNFICEKDTLE